MANMRDIAAYILRQRGGMTAMKLQKLVYYSQAWHLVWAEKPLFESRIEAWANGPVTPELYSLHRGNFHVTEIEGNPAALSESERASVDGVLEFYGDLGAHQLSELTHQEAPWKDARKGLDPGQRSNAEISEAAMFEYYDSLTPSA